MKIACITPDDLSTRIFCATLSRLLAARGVELVTISGPVEGQPPGLYREELRREVRSTHRNLPMRRFIAPGHDLVYLWRLYRILREERLAAVVTFTTKPNIFGQIAARLAGVPRRVMAIRGLGRTFNTPANWRERLRRRMMTALYSAAAQAAGRVWFTHPGDLAYFQANGLVDGRKVFLTRNAVDLTDFCVARIDQRQVEAVRQEIGLKAADQVVVMVARLIEPKGVREFALAAAALRSSRPDLHFLLIAPEEPGDPAAVPPSFIRQVEGRSNLHWLGFRKDVRELYALSDVAVLPSYYKEGGYPRALLEAMAYGKPVIAADTPECRGPVEAGRNGLLVPPRDVAALAQAIDQITRDPVLARRMGAHSLARMQREFDDESVFRSVIDELLLPPAPPAPRAGTI